MLCGGSDCRAVPYHILAQKNGAVVGSTAHMLTSVENIARRYVQWYYMHTLPVL